MNNPYAPPNADLISNDENQGYKSLRWKILFFLLLPMEIWSEYDAFTVNEFGDSLAWRVSSSIVYVLFLVGLFGLAYHRAYYTSKFWFYFLFVLITFDCVDLFDLVRQAPAEEKGFTIIGLIIISPLVLVSWYSIVKYSRVLPLNKSSKRDAVNGAPS